MKSGRKTGRAGKRSKATSAKPKCKSPAKRKNERPLNKKPPKKLLMGLIENMCKMGFSQKEARKFTEGDPEEDPPLLASWNIQNLQNFLQAAKTTPGPPFPLHANSTCDDLCDGILDSLKSNIVGCRARVGRVGYQLDAVQYGHMLSNAALLHINPWWARADPHGRCFPLVKIFTIQKQDIVPSATFPPGPFS
eukprot:EG_transcript_26331